MIFGVEDRTSEYDYALCLELDNLLEFEERLAKEVSSKGRGLNV